MENMLNARILVVLSIIYGCAIPIIAIMGGNVGKFAAIGGIVIGALWAITGVLRGGSKNDSSGGNAPQG